MTLGAVAAAWLPASWQDVAPYLSSGAFVVLLVRAGLGLSTEIMRRILGPALLLGALPVAAEFSVAAVGVRWLIVDNWSYALLAGFLVAAVSPAVVLPTMLNLRDEGLGEQNRVPDRIIGQTLVNALIAQTGILLLLGWLDPEGGRLNLWLFPLGLLIGALAGWLPRKRFASGAKETPIKIRLRALIALAIGVAVYFGNKHFGLEAVFATVIMAALLGSKIGPSAVKVRRELSHLWKVAEILLFVNLGAVIDLSVLGEWTLILCLIGILVAALTLRLATAWWLQKKTSLSRDERLYVTLAHVPKATIQAVFGVVIHQRLSGLGESEDSAAQSLLILAVLAILTTAPAGAVLLESLAKRLLPSRRLG